MRIALAIIAGTLLLPAGATAFAEPQAAASLAVEVGVVFSDDEIRIIRDHYHSHGEAGRGKSKHKSLPPGIAKNLARGKPLPPGIAKQSLPYELRRSLPPVRDGYERIIVGGKVLLVEIATQVIHDVLSDVILN